MNKSKLIILSDSLFVEAFIKDSIIPSNIKKLDLITNKKNSKLNKILKNNKIECNIHFVKKINPKFFKKKFNIKKSILILAGSTWIIKRDIIDLFKKNILNIHQSALPSLRGAVASFVKLYEIRALQTCLHVVKEKIDEGEIVYSKNIFISKEHDTPYKINSLLQKKKSRNA